MDKKFQAIGFDLGDTLIFYRDTPMSWVALYPAALRSVASACHAAPSAEKLTAAEQILCRYNTRITPRTVEVSSTEILSHILRAWDLDPSRHLPAATEAFFTFFQQQMSAYPETLPVLTALHARGVPIGVLTDVPYGMPREFVQRDLDGAGISGMFNAVITSVEVGVRKPEPTGYLLLAARLGVAPGEMLYIGNEPKDVIGARRAGLTAAFLDRARHGGNHGQHFTLHNLLEINDCSVETIRLPRREGSF